MLAFKLSTTKKITFQRPRLCKWGKTNFSLWVVSGLYCSRRKNKGHKSLWTKQLSISKRVCGRPEMVFRKTGHERSGPGATANKAVPARRATFWPDSTVVARQSPLTSTLSVKTTTMKIWNFSAFLWNYGKLSLLVIVRHHESDSAFAMLKFPWGHTYE